ncbi:MAG: GyrI-like domain-containing protein [Solirubrobacterales bacterium]
MSRLAATMPYPIKTTKLKPQPIAAARVTTPPSQLAGAFREVLPEVASYLQSVGATPTGPPFARFFDYTEEEADFEAGFPVAEPVPGGDGRVASGELPGGRAATTIHVGPYEGLQQAHEAIGEWVLANGHDPAGPVWEVYVTGPPDESDPSKWRTELVWPLRK